MNQLPFSNPFYTKTIVSNKNKTLTSGFPGYVKDFNHSDYDMRTTHHLKSPAHTDARTTNKFSSDEGETNAQTEAPRKLWS